MKVNAIAGPMESVDSRNDDDDDDDCHGPGLGRFKIGSGDKPFK